MLNETPVYVTYIADGIQTQWQYNLPYINTTSIKLFVSHNSILREVLPSQFTFDETTKLVTYPIDGSLPVPKDDIVLIWRQTPITQEEDSNHMAFKSEDVERMEDKLTAICQELSDRLDRCLSYDPTQKSDDIDAAAYIAELKAYRDSAEQYAGESAESADEAATSAANASASATNAASSATTAQEAAATATEKAEEVAQSATQALTDIDTAKTDAVDAINDAAATGAQTMQDIIDDGNGFVDKAKTYAESAQASAQSYLPKQIGELYYSQSDLSDDNVAALPGWTGQTVNYSLDTNAPVYKGLYEFVNKHPELRTNAESYETMVAQTGSCPFYVLDTANKTIRLPLYSRTAGSWGDPDWDSSQERTWGTEYTATQKGFVLVAITVAGQQGYMTINGRGFAITGYDSNDGSGGAFCFPVAVGDTYRTSGSYQSLPRYSFIPLKDSNQAVTGQYPWIVAQTTIDKLISLHGNYIKVNEYTQEEWDALETKPVNELSLVGSEDFED